MTLISIAQFSAAASPTACEPAAAEENPGEAVQAVPVLLEVPVQFNRYCYSCDCESLFVAGWETPWGLLAYCVSCGAERMVEWTRTTGEAA